MRKEYIKETGIATIRSLFGAVPYAGTALNEVFFDLRSRVKQNRINEFVDELTLYVEEVCDENIDIEYIKSDKFGDIFESILRHVANNSSKEKIKYFKQILVKEMIMESKTDFIETFLELISKINGKQIEILNKHRKYSSKLDKGSLGNEFRLPENYQLSNEQYSVYAQDLVSKGLLNDFGIFSAGGPLLVLEITEFGKGLLEFIEFHQ